LPRSASGSVAARVPTPALRELTNPRTRDAQTARPRPQPLRRFRAHPMRCALHPRASCERPASRKGSGAQGARSDPERRQCPPVDLRHCVIPAAGLGTRFLPATKALPKELLPVLDKPVIQWAVEEAVAAGATDVVLVLAEGKDSIAQHLEPDPELERILEERGKTAELEAVRRPQQLARFSYVYQSAPLGRGHAVLQAEPGGEGHTVACLLPDDLSWG